MIFHWFASLMLITNIWSSSAHLTVSYLGRTIAEADRSEFSIPLPGFPVLNMERYRNFIKMLDKQTYQPPRNAVINEQGRIVPGQNGSKLYQQEFTKQFYEFFFSGRNVHLETPMISIYPKVDSELLSNIRTKRIGHYVTYFKSSNKNRSHNISLATNALNNYVVFPGEIFSFNKAVGMRTESKGYLKAPVIVKGEFSEGIGGGICQVSSTLFNAADIAGLDIVQRYSHSRAVPYVPKGRDATVSWYGPDFQFANTLNQAVLIRAQVLGEMLVVNIFSSDSINAGSAHKNINR
ncbi:VanW family protein [Actinomycetes bacterium NPDC127524]